MKYPETLSRGKGGDVSRLRAAGISAHEANWYQAAGVSTADGMIKLLTVGIGGGDAFKYCEAGIRKRADMLAWKAAGIDGDEARSYCEAGIRKRADMLAWKAAGIDGDEASCYRAAGISTLTDAQEWKAAGIDGSEAHWYRAAGVTTLDEMLRLAKLGCDPLMCRNVVQPALLQSGDAVVDRLLTVGDDLNRFPTGTLTALGRPSRLADDLLAASDDDLRVAVVLAEDRYTSTGKVSVPFIRQSIGIL